MTEQTVLSRSLVDWVVNNQFGAHQPVGYTRIALASVLQTLRRQIDETILLNFVVLPITRNAVTGNYVTTSRYVTVITVT